MQPSYPLRRLAAKTIGREPPEARARKEISKGERRMDSLVRTGAEAGVSWPVKEIQSNRDTAAASGFWRAGNALSYRERIRRTVERPMGYAELIEKLEGLPQDKQREVFDFVEFLSSRRDVTEGRDGWTDGDFSEFALGQALRGMEDKMVVYSEDDLKERWQ